MKVRHAWSAAFRPQDGCGGGGDGMVSSLFRSIDGKWRTVVSSMELIRETGLEGGDRWTMH